MLVEVVGVVTSESYMDRRIGVGLRHAGCRQHCHGKPYRETVRNLKAKETAESKPALCRSPGHPGLPLLSGNANRQGRSALVAHISL